MKNIRKAVLTTAGIFAMAISSHGTLAQDATKALEYKLSKYGLNFKSVNGSELFNVREDKFPDEASELTVTIAHNAEDKSIFMFKDRNNDKQYDIFEIIQLDEFRYVPDLKKEGGPSNNPGLVETRITTNEDGKGCTKRKRFEDYTADIYTATEPATEDHSALLVAMTKLGLQ